MDQWAPGPEAGARVLVVDDDDTIRDLFAQALELAGMEVLTAADGRAALDLLQAERVSAVLLDNRMPGMTGLDVLRELRANARTRTLPVILVTAGAKLDERVRGLEAGADDYVVKPVDVVELVARVRAQLRGHAAWMEVLEGQLRERATVTEALCRLAPERTPELTADRICTELTRLRNLDCAVLVAFTDEGRAVPVARSGRVDRAVRIGLPLPPALGAQLRARAEQGAWSEQLGDQPPGSAGLPLLSSEASAAAYAPLRSRGRVLGLLALSAGPAAPEAPTDAVAQALSAAIDFAAVAAALLGPALGQRYAERGASASLRSVLDGSAFTPVFQPIVRLEDRRVVGYETLTRFADGAEPRQRFAEAAAVGMGEEMETTTMAAALEAARDRLDGHWLSVNVSPGFLASGGPESLARGAGIDLVLELTEHDPVDDYEGLSRAVQRLPSVRLSIDDAGAGYACLTHVLTLRPAFVKLDRGWVTGIDQDPARQALVAGLRSFTSRTGSTIIAEGVETPAELRTLRELRVELAQGFLLGRPVEAEHLPEMVGAAAPSRPPGP